MKIIEREFVRDSGWWCCARMKDWICGKALPSMFEIPHRVKTVWLSLHDKASPNRCSAKVEEVEWNGEFSLLFEEEEEEFSSEHLDKILKPFVGKTLHLQCEYMA